MTLVNHVTLERILPIVLIGALGSAQGTANHLHEVLVDAVVPGDLGVERRREQVALLDGDNPASCRPSLHRCQNLNAGAHLLRPGSPG